MSIFNPRSAEDRMAIVPLVGCVLPFLGGLLLLVLFLTGCATTPHHCVEEGWCKAEPGDTPYED